MNTSKAKYSEVEAREHQDICITCNMNTSRSKTSELEEICKILETTLEFYNTTFRSTGFEFGGKSDINNQSIELKCYSGTPYCIQMAECYIKGKEDMQYLLNHITIYFIVFMAI